MARFRKIDPRFWKDEKVRQLEALEKLLALYLFTGQSNRIGLFSFSPGEAVEDLGTSPVTFAKGFREVVQSLSLGWDNQALVLYLPTWWKYNTPENPNVLKSLLLDLHEVPQTALITRFSENIQYLPETFHLTFTETLAKGYTKPYPIRIASGAGAGDSTQEQEQETSSLLAPQGATRHRNEFHDQAVELLQFLNRKAEKSFRILPVNIRPIVARLTEGATVKDCRGIIARKVREWKGTEFEKFLRPETLFRAHKFHSYLGQQEPETPDADARVS